MRRLRRKLSSKGYLVGGFIHQSRLALARSCSLEDNILMYKDELTLLLGTILAGSLMAEDTREHREGLSGRSLEDATLRYRNNLMATIMVDSTLVTPQCRRDRLSRLLTF